MITPIKTFETTHPPPSQNKKLGRSVATCTFPHHCLYCRMMPGTRTGMTTPPGKTLKIDINIIRYKQGDKSCHPRDFDSLTTYQSKFVFFLILLLNFHLWQLHFHFIVLSMTTDQISIKDVAPFVCTIIKSTRNLSFLLHIKTFCKKPKDHN